VGGSASLQKRRLRVNRRDGGGVREDSAGTADATPAGANGREGNIHHEDTKGTDAANVRDARSTTGSGHGGTGRIHRRDALCNMARQAY